MTPGAQTLPELKLVVESGPRDAIADMVQEGLLRLKYEGRSLNPAGGL
jgi:hypothetical protein